MRRAPATSLLFLAALAVLACGPKPAAEPAKDQGQQPEPPAPAPAPEPETPPAPTDELPAIEGVHYLEILTGGAEAGDTLPMIIAIHGLGDSPQGFVDLFAGFDRPARVILPRALDPHEPGWSWFPIRARDPDVETLSAGIAKAADTLAPAIAALAEQRPTRGKPIITGFSQGGMLSFTLATHDGELFSAAFPVGGWLPPPLMPQADLGTPPEQAPPLIAFHGTTDKAVAYEPTKQVVDELSAAGYRAELRTYEGVGHAITPQMRADLFTAIAAAIDT
ncbi:MAG: prolyl oligopeptidase family serine peptidase, partial [Myxococcales bacterium]|nr:prolyl oligopeptidase family serine peptidase [Myxococcales bacterium]